MDNITHSLVGLAAADAVVRFREVRGKPQGEAVRRWFWTGALLAANLPDIDFAYSFITEGRLGYLLHHRGHTHTLVGLIPQFLILCWMLRFSARRLRLPASKADWGWAFFLLAFGELSHLGLDSLNSYGVHPLWPFDNRWFYGDTLFIVEPWLWLTLIPALYFSATTRLTRFLLSSTFVVGILLTLFSGLVPWFCSIPLAAAGLILWKGTRKFSPGHRTTLAILAAVLPILLFSFTSRYLKRDFALKFADTGGLVLKDIVLSPSPANPFCWSLFTLETYDNGKAYRIRSGVLAPVPSLVPPDRCHAIDPKERTAQWLPTTASPEESVLWFGEIRNTVEGLRKLAASHCQVAAFLRFARVPFFQEAGRDILMGDVRYDRQRGLGFAEIQALRQPLRCPEFVPPWQEPIFEHLH